MTRLDLLTDAAATAAVIEGDPKVWPGGKGLFMGEGTFGSQTMKLQVKSPQGTWIDIPDATMTAAGMKAFDCPAGEMRAQVSSGSPSGLYAWAIKGMP